MSNEINTSESNYQRGIKLIYGIGDSEINKREAYVYLSKSVEEGNVEACIELGLLYLFGEPEVNRNYGKAFDLFKKAADEGFAKAQFLLGECYSYGYGVPKNIQEAIKYYKKSSSQNYLIADDRLAYIYLTMKELADDSYLDKAYKHNERTRGHGFLYSEERYLYILKERSKKI